VETVDHELAEDELDFSMFLEFTCIIPNTAKSINTYCIILMILQRFGKLPRA